VGGSPKRSGSAKDPGAQRIREREEFVIAEVFVARKDSVAQRIRGRKGFAGTKDSRAQRIRGRKRFDGAKDSMAQRAHGREEPANAVITYAARKIA
jgi:hypothetical protein